MPRRMFLFCLALCAMCILLTVSTTQAQYAYGISAIVGDANTRTVDGYSATWLDYTAAYYYDPAVLGELYDQAGILNELPLDSGYREGAGIYPAEVFTHTLVYRPNTRYHVYSTHFVRAYYVYSSCPGFFFGCSFDPYGFSRFFGGGGGGGGWPGSGFQYLYVQTRRYTLGTTHVTIVTPQDAPPTPTPIPTATPSATPTPTPTPMPTPTATPCTLAPGASAPCPPESFILSFEVTPRLLLPVGVGGPAAARRATVKVSTFPAKAGKTITLELVRVENSGGHIDATHTGSRPLGRLGQTQGTLDSNGRFQTTYDASHIGQTIKVRMTYDDSITREVNVGMGVPDLEQLQQGENFHLVGATNSHPSNHWGTTFANSALRGIADDYKQEYYGAGAIPDNDKLRYNDQSLESGGKFEIQGSWSNAGSHAEHREGSNCDIRCCNGPGAVPRERWARLNQIFTARGSPNTNDETTTVAPHWHVRLTGGQAQAAIERAASDYIDATWWASLDREPSDAEWRNRLTILEAAQAQGAMAALDAARGLNRSLFNSVEYLNRNRSDEEYVTDLYETYLLREADRGGHAYWLEHLQADNAQGLNGRENLLRVFEASPEFVNLVTNLHGNAPPPSVCNPAERQQCIRSNGVWDPDTCTCTYEPDPCRERPRLCQ